MAATSILAVLSSACFVLVVTLSIVASGLVAMALYLRRERLINRGSDG